MEPLKHPSPYILGSIWKRRDGTRAVIASKEKDGMVRAVKVGFYEDGSYSVFIRSGRSACRAIGGGFTEGKDLPGDLIYRDED